VLGVQIRTCIYSSLALSRISDRTMVHLKAKYYRSGRRSSLFPSPMAGRTGRQRRIAPKRRQIQPRSETVDPPLLQ
jgi:hypothetical protein